MWRTKASRSISVPRPPPRDDASVPQVSIRRARQWFASSHPDRRFVEPRKISRDQVTSNGTWDAAPTVRQSTTSAETLSTGGTHRDAEVARGLMARLLNLAAECCCCATYRPIDRSLRCATRSERQSYSASVAIWTKTARRQASAITMACASCEVARSSAAALL